MSRMTWGVLITFSPAYLIVTYDLQTVAVALPLAAPLLGGRIARCTGRGSGGTFGVWRAVLSALWCYRGRCGLDDLGC
jgi:hypothetical protein